MADRHRDTAIYYTVFETALGWVGILESDKGLLRTALPQRSYEQAKNLLVEDIVRAILSPDRFKNLAERLQRYFTGHIVSFPDTLDLSGATPFQRRVWEVTRHIPCSETRSYIWVARRMDKPQSCRAVGQALGKNPLPLIIPCHRVTAADGTLGGFSGGLDMKKALIRMESNARSD